MKRTALLLALLALSGCLTECGAVGHGVIGRGVVSDGAIGGGAVGGRPTAGGCTVPGSPVMVFDAASIDQSDGTAVSSWPDTGSEGKDATQGGGALQPTFDTPCEGGGVLNDEPCVDFDGGDWVRTANIDTYRNQPNIVAAVFSPDAASTRIYVDGSDASHRHVLYQVSSQHWSFAGGSNTTTSPVVLNTWYTHSVEFNGTSSTAYVNGSEVVVTAGANPAQQFSGITIGASSGGSSHFDGRVAWVGAWDSGVTHEEIYAYLECRYGSFPQ